VPSVVTIDWMGLPVEDWRTFAEPTYHIQHSAPGSAEYAHAVEGLQSVERTARQAIVERRREPREDVLTLIANAEIEGELITEDRALGVAQLLLAGGVNTTTALTGHTLVYLDEHRDVHRALVEDDRFLHTATEELLRVVTPVL